jgi:hypothetical protein
LENINSSVEHIFFICACGGGQAGNSNPESAEKVANEISIPAPAVPAPAIPAPAVPAPVLPTGSSPVENPVIEKSKFKAMVGFPDSVPGFVPELVDVEEYGAGLLNTWICLEGKKGNLAGYEEGESEEISNKRYAKRIPRRYNCGIKNFDGIMKIYVINEHGKNEHDKKIKINSVSSNLESVKVTIREDLNLMSARIVPENNDPWPHIQIYVKDHLNEDIQIKGTFLDPEGKEGEFNATIKVHSISEEVYERWQKPEVSPVRVEFAEKNFIFSIFGRDEKELYVWKCPLDFDGNLEGLANSWPNEEEKKAAFDKATLKKGCGLIRHNKDSSFIPLNWMGNEVITKRRFERPSPIDYEKGYTESEKLYNAYGIQLPDDLIGFDSRRTAGILVEKFPRAIAVDRGVRIPIQIVDDQDRASISYLNLRFLLITDTLLEKWSYKGD